MACAAEQLTWQPGPVADLCLLWTPLKTSSLLGYSVSGMEEHNQMKNVVPPTSGDSLGIGLLTWFVGGARSYNLSFILERIAQYDPQLSLRWKIPDFLLDLFLTIWQSLARVVAITYH